MKIPISVFVITHNEEIRLPRTLDAVHEWVDQVVIVDSGSTDRTREVAESYNAEFYENEWPGYGPQKRFAEDRCRNSWLLNIDADEVVSKGLREEIERAFDDMDGLENIAGYNTPILNIYPGDEKPRLFANDYNVVRLYNRSFGRYRDHPVFDRVEMTKSGPIRRFKHPLYHHSLVDWFHMVAKANKITSHEIHRVAEKSEVELRIRIVSEFPLQFLKNYLWRRHIFGGWKGYVFALNNSFLRFLRIAKALEYKLKNSSR